ncbi:MAG: fatty acid desaturase [Phenylobacterium sp.]|uniref:fatty acid desaturase n=1 Tax=Phenylobacterium sp. TaxID=1871053 RepID=UPI002A36016F|nr:fatty acid desaturase [Phenylobacterium sp.]MDX9998148.1 fatty acid desaturase [Phenylobacterium sp.]
MTDLTATDWSRALAPYRTPRLSRSLLEIVITMGSLFALWGLAWFAFEAGVVWAALLLTLPAAFFLMRVFLIQHDCGHGSFFRDKAVNDWVGRVMSVFTLTPYDYWRRAHALHHATSGNLDRRGIGAIDTLTVEEYRALSPLRRLGYRLYRHPVVMFGLGPAFNFFIIQRVPLGMMREGWRPWVSTLGNTVAILAGAALLVWLVGLGPLVVNLVTMLLAATIGVWLFFVQHQFEGVYWARQDKWKRDLGALAGSSHYDLPPVLRWLTANIGIHHVHHLSSRIPYYRLPEVLRDRPELKDVSRIGLWESFKCARLALYDEARGELISFRELRRRS